MTHVLAKAVELSIATERQQWIVIRRHEWIVAEAVRRGDRLVAHACGTDVIRDGFGPRQNERNA